MSTKLFLSGIGFGWNPAIINSQRELDFIKENQKQLINEYSYWLGGSSAHTGYIGFSAYRPHQAESGKVLMVLMIAIQNKSISRYVF